MASLCAENDKGQIVRLNELTPEETEELIVHKGYWCPLCRFYEFPEDVEHADDVCQGCGCDVEDHVKVAIVGVT